MTEETRIADLWRWVFKNAAERPDTYCPGCGYYHVAHGEHRADCTATRTAPEAAA